MPATERFVNATTCPPTQDVGALITGWVQAEVAAAVGNREAHLRVYMDDGVFKQDTQINCSNCCVQIITKSPSDRAQWVPTGTWIRATGALPTNVPAILFYGDKTRGSSIQGLNWYDERALQGSGTTQYPTAGYFAAAVLISDTAGSVDIDMHMPSCKRGIELRNTGRVYIKSLTGEFYDHVLVGDDVRDTVYVERIHDWLYGVNTDNIASYMETNKQAIYLGRFDGLLADKVFLSRCAVGLYLGNISNKGAASKINFGHFYLDYARYGIYIGNANRDGALDPATYINTPSNRPLIATGAHVQIANYVTHHIETVPNTPQPYARSIWIDANRAVVQIANSHVGQCINPEFMISDGRYGSVIHVGSHMAWVPVNGPAQRSYVGTAPPGTPPNSIEFGMTPIVQPYGRPDL